MMYDTLKAAGDVKREIHLYDPFTGFAECDHKKDTGMCPTAGTSAPNKDALSADIREYGDVNRVKVHKVSFKNIPASELPDKVSMVIIDGALYNTVENMLASIHPKLTPGATVFIHDFGWEGFTGVERAVSDYIAGVGKGMRVVLPS